MKYALIAFKPEESYWCGDDKEIHSASLIREDNLNREEVVQRIFELSRKPEYVKDSSYFNSDCRYEEFHIFQDIVQTIEESDNTYHMIKEGLQLASNFNKEGERKQKEKWAKEREAKNQKELKEKKAEYEKLKLMFESENKNV